MRRITTPLMAGLAAIMTAASVTVQAQTPLKVLRVVPQANVVVTDPLSTTAWISTIHGTMIWETLFTWDFLERPAFDLLPVLRRDPNIRLKILTELASQAILRPNALHPPFNDPRARLALSYIVDQADEMAAGYGDPAFYRACNSFFVCGSPNGIAAGAEDFGPDLDRARALLAEAGYKGEPVKMYATRDIAYMGPMAEVTADAMRKAGIDVDLSWSDWGSVVSRVANQNPPAAGGWNIYITGAPGVLMWNPSTNIFANMSCDRRNLSGWPCDEAVETLRTAYADAAPADRPAILEQLQRRLAVVNPYRLLGQATQPVAYRSNLHGILASPV